MSRGNYARITDLESRLETVSAENDRLKGLMAEEEIGLAILRALRDRVSPR